jgi:hypothetical protein
MLRRIIYFIGTYGCTIPWLIGVLFLRFAYKMVVASDRLYDDTDKPDKDHLNCQVYAIRRFDKLHRRWIQNNCPEDNQPYIILRITRLGWHGVWHMLVAEKREASGFMDLESYKPIDQHKLGLKNILRAFRFKGTVKSGD